MGPREEACLTVPPRRSSRRTCPATCNPQAPALPAPARAPRSLPPGTHDGLSGNQPLVGQTREPGVHPRRRKAPRPGQARGSHPLPCGNKRYKLACWVLLPPWGVVGCGILEFRGRLHLRSQQSRPLSAGVRIPATRSGPGYSPARRGGGPGEPGRRLWYTCGAGALKPAPGVLSTAPQEGHVAPAPLAVLEAPDHSWPAA